MITKAGRKGEDVKGRTIGCLIPVEHYKNKGRRVWKCLCTCGKFTLAEYRNLRRYPNRRCQHVDNAGRVQ